MESKANTKNWKEYADDIKETLKGGESVKKYKTAFCIILLIALFLELFVFNFRAVESVFNSRTDIDNYSVTGAVEISNGEYRADNDTVTFKIDNVNQKIKNVFVDLERGTPYTTVQLRAVDEANSRGLDAPDREIVSVLKQTKYIRAHFSGEVESLEVKLKNMGTGDGFTLNGISLNAKVPICFSILRFLFVLGMMMLLYTFRPKSFVYKCAVDLKIKWQRAAVIAFLVIQIITLLGICNVNPTFKNPSWPHHHQYDNLAQAFLDGHTYLGDEPSRELINLENPYDPSQRNSTNASYKWDHAYFNGHYYVYFGVVPALLYYLPYRAVTGHAIPNYVVVFINCSLACIALLALLYSVTRKWFKNTSFGVFMLTAITVIDACGIIYIAKRPDFYSIPIIMAVMFAALGMTLWINSEKYNKEGEKYLSAPHLALGAVCMALVGGCRPHILLTTAFGVIFFWKAVFKERMLFSKNSIKNTIAICLPYVVIGVGLMIYNYARFGSPFDFGANYNLTTNDMTARGIVMDRNLTGIFYYFLQPLSVDAAFPYLHMVDVKTMYQGLTLTEKMSGGLLWMAPLTILGIRGLWNRKWYDKSDMRPYVILCAAVIMSVVIGVMDAQVAGILTRYYSDFAWMMLFGGAIALFAEYNYASSEKTRSILTKILLACFVISIVVTGFHIFNDVDNGVASSNQQLYYKMKYLIGFLV